MDKQFSDGEVIAATRKRLDITQTDLAKRAGVSQKLISAIETGVNPMVEPSRTRIWNALRDFELERIVIARRADELSRALGKARKEKATAESTESTGHDWSEKAADLIKWYAEKYKIAAESQAILAKQCVKLEEIIRAKDRLIEGQVKLIAIYEEEFNKQPEMLRHWGNEIRLRKESEASFRKELAQLQANLAAVPETVDAQQKKADEQGN